ncbi:hypothetical protein PGTUg99_005761 [Puccinia graminis f. sp. tritici]|uniref:Uncharacterized protein n=2 Tax=Puccinia graminis f. sp. tritici TaxID=56615 RepID=E3JZQ8_PUCGT|nr:uncharacterized protein PGTG_03489 [Puccinia graminis f. sp. tritici CRL 75-36-700-3]EFP77533.2 hypothetical protein PGTG_03489 [Puccinia graminis f. sp. tritici CRL 75-36-700-3]KAA1134859.1 hypothetical protein PGTUg99_005761 [Puccinia graminis f. sp. tritici]
MMHPSMTPPGPRVHHKIAGQHALYIDSQRRRIFRSAGDKLDKAPRSEGAEGTL